MKHSETSYLWIGGATLICSFAVIVLQLVRSQPPPTEAWFTVGMVVGHYFGRSNGNGNGYANGATGK